MILKTETARIYCSILNGATIREIYLRQEKKSSYNFVSIILKKFEKMKLVRHEYTGRSNEYYLTSKGKKLQDELKMIINKIGREVIFIEVLESGCGKDSKIL